MRLSRTATPDGPGTTNGATADIRPAITAPEGAHLHWFPRERHGRPSPG
ncbi:hypothetical protein ACH4TX_26760 [Streptomyces sp. NPDC021098]